MTRLPPVNTARRIRRRLSHQWVSPKAAWYLLWRIYRVFEGTFMSEALDEEVGRFTELTFFRWCSGLHSAVPEGRLVVTSQKHPKTFVLHIPPISHLS